MNVLIPETHVDLLQEPYVVSLITMMPNGYPQATAVWCKYDAEGIRILTRDVTQKYKNIVANPKVTVIAIDPNNGGRYVEVRGEARITRAGANELLKEVATSYGRPNYPIEEGAAHRVIITITPQKVFVRA